MMDEKTSFFEMKKGIPQFIVVDSAGTMHKYTVMGKKTIGRESKTDKPDISIDSKVVSRNHGYVMRTPSGFVYCDNHSTNGTYYNGHLLKSGVLCYLKDGDVLYIHGKEDEDHKLDVILIFTQEEQKELQWTSMPLTKEQAELIVGRNESIQLQDKAVSRKHASFFLASKGWAVIDHDSKNGMRLNNKAIHSPVYLQFMDVVRISRYFFIFLGDRLLYQTDVSSGDRESSERRVSKGPQLSISIVERNVWKRFKKQTLLKDINLDIPVGNMVLILGGSGAGKTTLMNAVMGYEPAEGTIMYGDTNIYQEYKKMKYQIGYVPQQDLIRDKDTVYHTLKNAAKMRLERGKGESFYNSKVDETLKVLGLQRERDSLVSKLSGGQKKRLSIAVEYIGNPSLFFLDEPDSGLDGIMARELMENLRNIADEGKIVMVISHSPDRAFELFDKVIVLAKDSRDNCGHLAYYGNPKAACEFFETDKFEGIVKKINRSDEGGEGKADYYIEKFSAKRVKK
ncbi:MAG: ATP-binding cassette domain-containing protein [Lachnospiraceae bacterium]|nr:ATP-binding cassette domain-containing protein [Lachnospiraceae bacterium]MDD3616644.1 ATP-binding cassette domain-containing protein [Lachnospiraceae bacterium]